MEGKPKRTPRGSREDHEAGPFQPPHMDCVASIDEVKEAGELVVGRGDDAPRVLDEPAAMPGDERIRGAEPGSPDALPETSAVGCTEQGQGFVVIIDNGPCRLLA